MTLDNFLRSVEAATPPAHLSPALRALWHSTKGEWDEAHDAIRDDDSIEAAWVRGHTDRAQGHAVCARQSYAKARMPMPNTLPEMERITIAKVLIASGNAV